jgi:hypothetical protein
MDVRAVPQHRYAGGPCLTDADERADALVATLIASDFGSGRRESVSSDVVALVERYVDVLRDAGYSPECVVIALKDAIRRAHREGLLARQSFVGAYDRHDFQLVCLGIRRLYVTREVPPRYSTLLGEQVVATAMLRSAALIERAVAAVEQTARLVTRSQALRTSVLLDHTAWLALEQSVREVAHAFKRLAVKEEDAIIRVRALVDVSVHRHTGIPDRERMTARAAQWAHDAYTSAA